MASARTAGCVAYIAHMLDREASPSPRTAGRPVRLTNDTYSFGAGLLGGELVDTPLGGFPRFEH